MVPEFVWGCGLVDSLVDEGDGEDGRGVVEVVAQGRVEVVSVKRLRSAYLVRLGKVREDERVAAVGACGVANSRADYRVDGPPSPSP